MVEQIVIAISVPLMSFRVLEEVSTVDGFTVHRPVRNAEAALSLAQAAALTIFICDERLSGELLQAWPRWRGRMIILSANPTPWQPPNGPPVVTLPIQSANWSDRLRQLLHPPAAPVLPSHLPRQERRRSRSMTHLNALISDSAQRDSVTNLPGAAAFDEALRQAPGMREPSYLLFVDFTEALPPDIVERARLDRAGGWLRFAVRTGDLVFRLDATLFAVLIACVARSDALAAVNRIRWMISTSDLIRPDLVLCAGAFWEVGMPMDQVLTIAWQQLFEHQDRKRHA